jgi:hypothetical protein
MGGSGVSARQAGIALAVLFVIVLAVVIGKKMSTEAMAVVIGVVCGVAAGIPTSLLLMLALTRRDRQQQAESGPQASQRNFPPVVVIQGGTPQMMPSLPQAGYWPAATPPPSQRQFHIVGDDDLLTEDMYRHD